MSGTPPNPFAAEGSPDERLSADEYLVMIQRFGLMAFEGLNAVYQSDANTPLETSQALCQFNTAAVLQLIAAEDGQDLKPPTNDILRILMNAYLDSEFVFHHAVKSDIATSLPTAESQDTLVSSKGLIRIAGLPQSKLTTFKQMVLKHNNPVVAHKYKPSMIDWSEDLTEFYTEAMREPHRGCPARKVIMYDASKQKTTLLYGFWQDFVRTKLGIPRLSASAQAK